MNDYIVTVMAQDRVGIVRDVSSALAVLCGNITHLSQTVLRGYFTLIISVEMPDERSEAEIRNAVREAGAPEEFEVGVKRFRMPEPGGAPNSERFTLSMQGSDRNGIIARATSYLAERGINIEDFYFYVHDGTLLVLAQVAVPIGVDIEAVQAGLEQVGREFDLVVHFQHEGIFRATSDVRPVMDLQRSSQ